MRKRSRPSWQRRRLQKDEILSQANDDAKQLIKEAREAASKVTETENQKAIKQAEEIIAKAREASEADRDAMMAELKAEIGGWWWRPRPRSVARC